MKRKRIRTYLFIYLFVYFKQTEGPMYNPANFLFAAIPMKLLMEPETATNAV